MLNQLVRYTEVADLQFIKTFLETDKDLPEAESLFSHVLNSQNIWIGRISQRPQIYDRFHIHPKEKFMELHRENIANLNSLLSSDLALTISYANSEGGFFENSVSDILFHIINHSTYHRAQVASQFRINNVKPPVTDFIILKREGLL